MERIGGSRKSPICGAFPERSEGSPNIVTRERETGRLPRRWRSSRHVSQDLHLEPSQRTAGRQARGICKAGFLVKAGYRIGIKCDLQEIHGEEDMEQRVQKYREEGRKYV